MKLPSSRLFWKLFFSLWLAMMFSFACGFLFLHLSGQRPPDGNDKGPLPPFVFALVFSFLFSMGLAWYLSRPLHHLRWALRRAANAQFDTRVLPLMGQRRDEIVDLAGEFDNMAARLQQLTRQRQQLFHDVSHELRSPLARMQAAIGLLQQNPALLGNMLGRIEAETGRMDALIEELLTLHRLEAGSPHSPREALDVVELLTAIAHDASFEASVRNCSVVLQTDVQFVAKVDGELIYRAFENVVRNAVKYTAEGTSVEISVRLVQAPDGAQAASQKLEVSVQDQGPGVPAEYCETIFEPFKRLENSSPGTGLGLAIARRAIASHGGTIHARPGPQGGLLVVMVLAAGGGMVDGMY
ncbi:MAG: HAMP domain-containing sensor histidine kinase [Pseudomonadota bacterium]